jgi:phosphoglycerol transferase MdoB-like AlkP superfamily enzyme
MKEIPSHVKALFLFMGITLGALVLAKVIFLIPNHHAFPELGFTDVLASMWFELITVSMVYFPFLPFWLLPVNFRKSRWYKLVFRLLFFVLNFLSVGINLMDVVYFKYTSKRSTFDLFSMVGYEQDMNKLWEAFARDFWWLALIFIGILWFTDFLFRRVYKCVIEQEKTAHWRGQLLSMILLLPLFVIVGRGGFSYKPVSVISAAQFTRPENTAFVLNTAFTMIKSFNDIPLEPIHYFEESELTKIFSPVRKVGNQTIAQLSDSTNVMIIILESFGHEWVGPDKKGNSFTPFFDSLCQVGHYFPNGFANGKKSIEALPAILASLPGLTDNPYISSPYASNKLEGLGNVLKTRGYHTSFFHGATNGSMNFDGFSALVGFDHYFGRTEYGNEVDNDGTWGIFDHKFLPWTANQLTDVPEPFCSVLFTLSSHHPYNVPDSYKSKLPSGPHPICQSIAYTDEALRLFFNEAAQHKWFDRTLFVFVADHTPASTSPIYGQRIGMYQIPIVYVHAGGALKAKNDTRLTQQIDIFPSILDLLGIEKTIYTFGQSTFSPVYEPFAVTYMEGTHQLFQTPFVFTLSSEKRKQMFNFVTDLTMQQNETANSPKDAARMERFLKAFIQTFNNDLRGNKTHLTQ